MAPKTKIENETKSERFELAKSISNICTKMENFNNAVADIKEFSKDALNKLDLDIETKKIELQEIQNDIQHSTKNAKIEIDIRLREYKQQSATDIITELGDVVVPKKEYIELTTELEKYKIKLLVWLLEIWNLNKKQIMLL
jgi:hypothetical protein